MQDMMHCLTPSVLERQRACLQETNNNNFSIESFFSLHGEVLGDAWPCLNTPPQYAINMGEELVTPTSTTTNITTETTISNSTSSVQACKEKAKSKKRKADKSPMVVSDDDEKRRKEEEGSEFEGGRKENTADKKPDYIHVRARRGQATDSHSLAERVRRERISERMKYLQGLVPGCNKITGKAGMLEEIINYVQSLQRQVEFLSMKLAAMNPKLDFSMEALLTKEMNLPMSTDAIDQTFFQFATLQQAIASCGIDMAMTPAELAHRRKINAPISAPDPFLDSCFNIQRISAGWENEMYNQYGPALSLHSLQGNLLPNNLKTEM